MEFDVIVIGASSSGLFAAELLAKEGVKVALFEREKEIDPARRTYIITQGLRRVMEEIPSSLILHQISNMAVETPQEEVLVPLKDSDLIIERNQMRKQLANRARGAGAEIFLGMEFKGFDRRDGRTQALFEGEGGKSHQVTPGTVLGADGVYSSVAKAAQLPRPFAVPLLQAEMHLPTGWPRGLTKVWFDPVDTRYFFWLIPESHERAVVGLIGEPGKDIRQILDRFMGKHGFRALGMQSGQAAMHHPQLEPWGQVGEVDVLLVGDSAGQVKVTTVGGTVTGFWGARAAAQAILTDQSYADTLRPLKRELDLHWWIRRLLERLDSGGYDRLVANMSSKVVNFLGTYDRDHMRRHFWKLPFLQPLFIPFGLGLLLKSPYHEPLPVSQDQ